ncbi:MAG: hypothetical protein K6L73_15015 [Cellvibrionaceae bacterium]
MSAIEILILVILLLTPFAMVCFLVWKRANLAGKEEFERIVTDANGSLDNYELFELNTSPNFNGPDDYIKLEVAALKKELISRHIFKVHYGYIVRPEEMRVYLKFWRPYEKEPKWVNINA